jgi:hypothetical protein
MAKSYPGPGADTYRHAGNRLIPGKYAVCCLRYGRARRLFHVTLPVADAGRPLQAMGRQRSRGIISLASTTKQYRFTVVVHKVSITSWPSLLTIRAKAAYLRSGTAMQDAKIQGARRTVERNCGRSSTGTAVIRCTRKLPCGCNARLWKLHRRIETAFSRLVDFQRFASRYDRLARKLPSLYLARRCSACGSFNESGPTFLVRAGYNQGNTITIDGVRGLTHRNDPASSKASVWRHEPAT